jgi:hypothetical protein
MRKEYDLLKSEFNLPSFDDLNKDFDIEDISKDDNILREIVKKMNIVVDFYINFLEDVIHPDSRYYSLKEANVLDKELRMLAVKIYNKLMYLNRAGLSLYLNYSKQGASLRIVNVFNEWQLLKKDLFSIVVVLKDSWLNNNETKQDGGYFG